MDELSTLQSRKCASWSDRRQDRLQEESWSPYSSLSQGIVAYCHLSKSIGVFVMYCSIVGFLIERDDVTSGLRDMVLKA